MRRKKKNNFLKSLGTGALNIVTLGLYNTFRYAAYRVEQENATDEYYRKLNSKKKK